MSNSQRQTRPETLRRRTRTSCRSHTIAAAAAPLQSPSHNSNGAQTQREASFKVAASPSSLSLSLLNGSLILSGLAFSTRKSVRHGRRKERARWRLAQRLAGWLAAATQTGIDPGPRSLYPLFLRSSVSWGLFSHSSK